MVLKPFKSLLKKPFKSGKISSDEARSSMMRTPSSSSICSIGDGIPASETEHSQSDTGRFSKVAHTNEFIKAFNERRWDDLEHLVDECFLFEFYDVNGDFITDLDNKAFVEEAIRCANSFPDWTFVHKILKEGGTEEPLVIRLVSSGTHTGAPYGIGPHEPIAASGKRCVNDPEELQFFFQEDKICKIKVYPKGDMTGPYGFYTQLGGFPLL